LTCIVNAVVSKELISHTKRRKIELPVNIKLSELVRHIHPQQLIIMDITNIERLDITNIERLDIERLDITNIERLTVLCLQL